MAQRRVVAAAALAAAAAAGAPSARATWSIILIDTRTGEIAAGSATCLTGFDLRANTPVMLTGIGAATAQSFVDSTQQNRTFIRDRLALGVAPADIITGLATFDTGHQTRQYGIADTQGRTATFSGTGANAWAGGQTGSFAYTGPHGEPGTIAYAIQGNILTGACVVDAAVQAAINTPGDLAAKLMASMEAARVTGGDGRCSCPGNPTGCGCPPASFTKSAHIAYMLITRTGDRDGTHGAYRAGSAPYALVAADFNNDGRIDLLTANSASNNVSILSNNAPAGAGFGTFALPTHFAGGTGARGVALADLTGDGVADVVTANYGGNSVSVLPGTGPGQFGGATSYATGPSPIALAVGNFDHQHAADIVTANQTGNTLSVLLSNGAGGLTPGPLLTGGSDPRSVAVGDVNGDGHTDIIAAARSNGKLVVHLGAGNGTFTPAPDIFTVGLPTKVLAADLDGLNGPDLIVGGQGAPAAVAIYMNSGNGTFAIPVATQVPAAVNDMALGDLTGDGADDLLLGLTAGRLAVMKGVGSGQFELQPGVYTVASGITSMALADYNGDGDLDAALASAGASVFVVENLGDGTFTNGLGTGQGDYFMGFNVANQQAPAPDPVAQLQALYGPWRTALENRPDAIQSLATRPSPGTLRVELRDWRGMAATAPIVSLTVGHGPGSAGKATFGTPASLGGGVFEIPVTLGHAGGTDRLRIVADDGTRPVTLMPDFVLGNPCYADCDGGGTLNVNDYICFQTKFAMGDPYADCDGNGVRNVNDYICFQTRFALSCS